jgi:hypothetical protein
MSIRTGSRVKRVLFRASGASAKLVVERATRAKRRCFAGVTGGNDGEARKMSAANLSVFPPSDSERGVR